MRAVRLLAAIWIIPTAFAEDAGLRALHQTLATVHSHAAHANIENSGASPELTTAKHQLRDWIETQLDSLNDSKTPDDLAYRINQTLKPMIVKDTPDDQNLLGSLDSVRVRLESGILVVTTAVGVLCEFDESAYAYRLSDGHWRRFWESEQLDYSPKKYAPQHLNAVHVWQSFKNGRHEGPTFILTLGNNWGCSSSWHPVYYRVWRIDAEAAKLLLDRSESAFLRADNFIVGSIGQDIRVNNPPVDVLIEFTEGSVDAGVHNREAIRHFVIDGDKIQRIDPVALGPRDFVDEWLTRPWSESASWSASPALQRWHRKLHGRTVYAMFARASLHCETPDLWQVALKPDNAANNLPPAPEIFFLVRWRPPYKFALMDISDQPRPRCNQKDPEADAWRTLFNTQGWRW